MQIILNTGGRNQGLLCFQPIEKFFFLFENILQQITADKIRSLLRQPDGLARRPDLFVVAIVAYTFYGLDALGDELEEPFGMESNDLALDSICRGIEISVCQALGDPQLPAPLEPVNYQLT